MASGSGTAGAGSQSSVGESEGQSGPGVVDPKFPLWAYVEKLIPTATANGTAAAASGSRGGNTRNWSTYGFIHSAARNKLTPPRAADLVYTHNNHRLLSRNSKAYQTGPSRMWDVGGDGVETFTGVGMLESADLSLDEPELEEEIIDSLT